MSDTTDESAPTAVEAPREAEMEELLPPGNPPQWLRGGALLALGAFVSLCVMGYERPLRWGVPLGLLGVLVAAVGALDLAGSFDDDEERVVRRVGLPDLKGPLLWTALSAAWTFVVLLLSVRGSLSPWVSALLVPCGAIGAVVGVYRAGEALGPWALDEQGRERPLLRRHGFWVVAAACALYLPAAGVHSLTDPWETHYGEVAREMLARDDWVSTWWAQDGWFFSKPVWNFWIQALSMSALGVQYQPGEMLAPGATGAIPRPEWAVRLPVVVMAVVALYLLYKGVSRVFGRRAGLLGALVLMSMPQWSMLAHQTMTDMPFVAALTSAMGLLMLGIYSDPAATVPVYEVQVGRGRARVSAFHLVFGVILLCALPQIFYLVSRNVELVLRASEGRFGFRWHGDTFWSGSRGNCGLPGNEACTQYRPFNTWMQPGLQGLLWAVATGALLYLNWGERRVQRLCAIGAFFFAAVATLGKGPAGLALPMLCALLYVGVTGRWRELTRMEILSGVLLLLAVALPWYVAMYMRHGPAFIDRLIFHDMWKRALTHVHDTNEGDDVSFRFYLWQLGYAFFPWSGLVPVGLVWWARRPDDGDRGRGDASVFLAMWFLLAFTLFAWMLTKFHHYIFPAVPPAAMLTGVLLDRLLGEGRPLPAPRLVALGLGGALLAYGCSRFFPGALDGFRGDDGLVRPATPWLGALAVLGAVGLGFWGLQARHTTAAAAGEGQGGPYRGGDEPGATAAEPAAGSTRSSEGSAGSEEGPTLGAAVLAGVALLALVGRDLATRPPGDLAGESRLMHLFTYNYRRSWPDSLDFTGVLAGVAVAAAVLSVLLAARRLRSAAVVGLVGLSLAFGVFCLDVYFVKTAPHWGQRETLEAYFRLRAGPQEPIVAYQMNWKGENFYTGNHIAAFVASGDRFKAWVKEQRDRGVSTMFFTTEHTRVSNLRSELGNPTSLEVLSDRRTNNKFTLVRVRF